MSVTMSIATKGARVVALAIAVGLTAMGSAMTQTVQGVPNAVQGFSQNRDQPVHIAAATLEVRDKDKVATFAGDVQVVQGDTTMRSKTLLVYYDQDQPQNGKATNVKGSSMKAAAPGPGGSQQIRKLEAKGGVIVTQKDQVVTGESGVFDMKSNTVTMQGGVVLTQGQNVLRGDRLIVNMTTGISRVEVGQGGRVQGIFQGSKSDANKGPVLPGTKSDAKSDAKPDTKSEAKPEADEKRAPAPATGKPLPLNNFPPKSKTSG